MTRILPILLLFLAFSSSAQYTDYEYQGKTYKVYPPRQEGIRGTINAFPKYKQDYYSEYTDDGKTGSPVEADIIPYFDSLPDGEYLVFGPKGFKSFQLLKLKKTWSKKDTTDVNITFTIKNGKKNGLARWYGDKGQVLMEGNFVDDDKSGEWKCFDYEGNHTRSTNFIKGLREGKDVFFNQGDTVATINYETDRLQGEIKIFFKDRLAMRGQYEKGDRVGRWIYYWSNGNLASRWTYIDTVGTQILPFLYRSDLKDAYERFRPIELLVDEDVLERTKLSRPELLDSLGITSYDMYYQNESKYDGTYERFSYDGKPIDIRLFKGGFLTEESKLYDGIGRLKETVDLDVKNDSLRYAHVTRYNYFSNSRKWWGKRTYEIHRYYRNKTTLYEIEHRHANTREQRKHDAKKYTNIDYYDAYFDSVKNRDTIVIKELRIRDDEDTLYAEKVHLETGYNFTNAKLGITETRDKKGRLTHTKEITYDKENKRMLIHAVTYNLGGNLSWHRWSSYQDKGVSSDSSLLMFENKPYTGKVEFVQKQAKKDLAWMEGDVLNSHTRRSYRTGEYLNGKIHGEWVVYNKKGLAVRTTNYNQGELHGKQTLYSTKKFYYRNDRVDARKQWGIKKKEFYYLTAERSYKDGYKHGLAKEYHWNGQIAFEGTYDEGKRNGTFSKWNIDGDPIAVSGYKNDSLDGISKRWNTYTHKLSSLTGYKMGMNHGVYKQWAADGDIVVSGQTENDYKTGMWFNYYDDSILKSTVEYNLADSVQAQTWKDVFEVDLYQDYSYKIKKKSKYNSSYGLRNTWSDYDGLSANTVRSVGTNEPGKYTFYFKTGEVSRKGEIKGFSRVGIWEIWDEGGTKIKEINYEPGEYIHIKDDGSKDTISHYGFYKSWHSSGNKEVEGYILSEYSNYNCYQEVQVSVQDLFYVEFWDDAGNHTVTNGNGYLYLYNRSAKPTSEGFLKDGQRNGLWKFRDIDGGLNEIGHYTDGVRNGKWYEGDLTGLHFVDDACFDLSNEEVKEKVAYDKNILDVTIIYYDMGSTVNRISYRNNTNPEPLNKRRSAAYRGGIIDF